MLVGCTSAAPTETDETDTVPTVDTAERLALITWTYVDFMAEGTTVLSTPDSVPFAEFDSYLFTGDLLGPSLVADIGHSIRYSITNQTTASFDLDFEGVEVVEDSAFGPATTSSTRLSIGREPLVAMWSDPAAKSAGMAGLIIVRDPAEFTVNDFDEHINLVFYQPEPTNMRIDPCFAAGETPCGVTEPAPSDFRLLIAQRPTQQYFPPNEDLEQRQDGRSRSSDAGEPRHGGPPNEFTTSSPIVNRMLVTPTSDVRVHLYNATDAPVTIDLGGFPITIGDPGPITLQPGEGTHRVSNQPAAGEYDVTCPGSPYEWACNIRLQVGP